MIALLQSKDSQIRAMQIRKVGSLYSDLRVGRPYEADILLISERNTKRLTSRLLFETVEKMVPDLNRELADTHWKIVAVYEHQVGIALAVVALDGSEKPVGLLIDLVLMGSEFQSIKHEISKSYLKALDKMIQSKTHGERSDLIRYTLLDRRFDLCPLQFQIVKSMPEHVRRAYRVVKYLLQSHLTFPITTLESR